MASIQKREGAKGTVYRVLWREDGRQRNETVKSYREAQSVKADVEQRLRMGTTLTGDKWTLDEWHARWMKSRDLRPNTEATNAGLYHTHVEPVLGSRGLRDIKPLDVQDMITNMDRSPATVQRVYQEVRQMFNDAVVARVIPSTPCVGIKIPKTPDEEKVVYDATEVAAIAEKAGHYRTLIHFLAHSGVRIGEAAALKVSDYDGSAVEVRGTLVNGKVQAPKTRASRRRIPLPQHITAMLDEQIKNKKPGDWLFTGPRGAAIDARNLNARKFKEASGGKGTLHSLRHTAISHWLASGIDIATASRWAGHAQMSTTLDVYGHWIPKDDKVHLDKLNN